ncbi:hypothetical protein BU14_1454s0001 [Porphyra umbilicalis]|uniref:Uncharacterized protein n=1 Tax=Porphyra umbilicalis TaxID=2786 RepID=A0A1X6NLI3_PORUM|nr:hypothetical protein BU14_1454s0001 [Porphyra umbilicalis]|eukprot:OSX69501.1 hypothetical protein BU14_1454s0001 [Porphyra umbilicalis]
MDDVMRSLGSVVAAVAMPPPTSVARAAMASTDEPAPPVEESRLMWLAAVDDEEASDILAEEKRATAAATRQRREAVLRTSPDGSPAVPFELAINFAPVPTLAALKGYKPIFVSVWMLRNTSTWPQTACNVKRRKLNDLNIDCTLAGPGAERGTNATMKTWAPRTRTVCSFAKFVGESMCVHPGKPRPTDAEIDRGVAKFFCCLNASTIQVITRFLDCRRRGYPIAGGEDSVSAVTMTGYTSALSFLFGAAKTDGPGGVDPFVIDCAGTTTPWGPKGGHDFEQEKKLRADPGMHVGNPMAGDNMKDFRGATHKDARHGGEHSLSSAPVTPAIMSALHDELAVKHLPSDSSSGANSEQTTRQRAAATAAERMAATQASVAQADLITYILYVFAFITLARPVTLAHLRFGDVSYPDLMISNEYEVFNRYINLELRIVKTGTLTTDVMTVRLYSYFTVVSEHDVRNVGANSYVHCPCEHLNVPQLFNSLLLFASSAPGVGTDVGMLYLQPLFPSLLSRSVSGAVSLLKRRSETEINTRFLADLSRVGLALMLGERACRMHGFRRGRAQVLLDLTGKFELVMRLGGWTVTSTSVIKYLSNMNARGTLRSSLRSFRADEVTQIVAQLTSTYSRWTVGVVREVVQRALGEGGVVDRAACASIEQDSVKILCTLLCECVLALRHGKEGAAESDDDKATSDAEDAVDGE